jgi:hypothetical protein
MNTTLLTTPIATSSPLMVFRPEVVEKLFSKLGGLDKETFMIGHNLYTNGDFEYTVMYPEGTLNPATAVFVLTLEEKIRTMTFQEITQMLSDEHQDTSVIDALLSQTPPALLNEFLTRLRDTYNSQMRWDISSSSENNPSDWHLAIVITINDEVDESMFLVKYNEQSDFNIKMDSFEFKSNPNDSPSGVLDNAVNWIIRHVKRK